MNASPVNRMSDAQATAGNVAGSFVFDRFVLDLDERRLSAGDYRIKMTSRYFDALALLVREQGRLLSKERLLGEVWHGVPVTDEALTQCIKTLRRLLGDDASNPRFIQTVPKHGYRFIAPVREVGAGEAAPPRGDGRWQRFFVTGAAGTAGGAVAGALGGLVYGFAAASQARGVGGLSVLLVLLCATTFVATVGAAGVSFAVAAARLSRSSAWQWTALAGAGGGLVVGALGKLLGVDALTLLVGRSPVDITGSIEGLLLGAAVGLGIGAAPAMRSVRAGAAVAGAFGGGAGVLITLLGARLMLGSLESLALAYPGSRLHLDQVSGLLGERGFGLAGRLCTTALEGALFSGCIVGAILIAERKLRHRAN